MMLKEIVKSYAMISDDIQFIPQLNSWDDWKLIMGVDHRILRHSGQFRGLDKRSSDIDRTMDYSTNMNNAAYRASGDINKRKRFS